MMMSAPSLEIANRIRSADFSGSKATVVGFGNMGKNYVKALQTLRVGRICVSSRREEPLEELKGVPGVTALAGGYERLDHSPAPGELAIIAVPTLELIPAARHLLQLGYKKILIEKPVALYSAEIEKFGLLCSREGETRAPITTIFGAYNRVCYPSLLEARCRIEEEGGITSAHLTPAEMVRGDWVERFPREELSRWGASNSVHVLSMACALIGFPETVNACQRGKAFAWHPSGSVFTASGVTAEKIPFSLHADWESKERWSLEVFTKKAAWRFCPLEKLYRKSEAFGSWEEVPVTVAAPELKAGFLEQTAAALNPEIRAAIPLMPLSDCAQVTRFAEKVFGYPSEVNHG